jgi:hypothetical protein
MSHSSQRCLQPISEAKKILVQAADTCCWSESLTYSSNHPQRNDAMPLVLKDVFTLLDKVIAEKSPPPFDWDISRQ